MKKILSILLICIFVLSMPLCAYADESAVDSEFVDTYTYYMKGFLCVNIDKQYGSFYNYINVEFTIDKQICGYFSCDGYTSYLYMCIYDDTGVLYGPTSFLTNLRNKYNCIFSSSLQIEGKGKYLGDNNYEFSSKSYEGELGSLFEIKSRGTSFEENGFLSTNIPYFSSREECMAYINGEIGAESALNYSSDLLTTVTDSDEVPLPKNLRIEYDSTNYNYYLMWEYEPKDLEKLTVIAVTGIDKDLFTSPKNLDNYMRYPADIEFDVSLDEYLEPRLSYKLDITDDVVRLRRTIDEENDFSLADYRVTLDYWVIGSWQKNSTEFHTSKISHVELILDSSDKGFKIDTDNYITDKDMNVLDDVEFDTSIDFETNNSSSGFIGNLIGAFGLLGSNGFLACCKAVFGCFPSFIWDLLGAGLSAAIIIVLIKMLFS